MNALSTLTVGRPAAAPNVRERICRAVVEASERQFGEQLRTVLLTGSLARNEATVQPVTAGYQVLGDAEFVLVLKGVPARNELLACIAQAEETCAGEQVLCKIGCSAVRPDYFDKVRPSIYSYELLHNALVCSGDDKAFRAASRFPSEVIPREDAWRMLCNRLIELLEVLPGKFPPASHPEIDYRSMKLTLDLATSILVFAGFYQPSYGERARTFQENLQRIPAIPGIELSQFSKQLDVATDAKLGRAQVPNVDQQQVQTSIRQALAVCSWQLQQMLGECAADGDSEVLMQRWIRQQSGRARIRGWAYVLREQGWFASRKEWLRWARMAVTASPRYWIYAAALQAGQQFVSNAFDTNSPGRLELPLRTNDACSQATYRQAIAHNYHECAVGTTA